MPFTRAQATSLLNQAEMGLYDDSRANAVRRLRVSDLDRRVERAGKARDRARDRLQGLKPASSARSEGKHKAELLADIIKRFERQLKAARQLEKREGAKPAAKRPAPVKRASTRKAPASRTHASSASATRKPAKKSTSASSPGKKAATRSPAKTPATKPARKITPKQALANTRKLLQAKQAHDRQPQPWQTLDPQQDHVPQAGYQSGEAADKAQELHAGESRMAPIHGSIGTRDRRNQGKRDHRGDTE